MHRNTKTRILCIFALWSSYTSTRKRGLGPTEGRYPAYIYGDKYFLWPFKYFSELFNDGILCSTGLRQWKHSLNSLPVTDCCCHLFAKDISFEFWVIAQLLCVYTRGRFIKLMETNSAYDRPEPNKGSPASVFPLTHPRPPSAKLL